MSLRRTPREYLLGLGAALLAATVLALPAHAAAPAPCQGIFVTDPVGDVQPGVGYSQSKSPPQPNEDIEAVYFTVHGGVTTLNIQIANLDKTVTPGYTTGDGGIYYYGYWSYGSTTEFVKAVNTGSGDITYSYGHNVNPGVYFTDGSTKGAFTEGPHGVVSIEIPAVVGGKPGEVLKGFVTTVDTIEGRDDQAGLNHTMDDAGAPEGTPANPVTPNGTDYTVAECAPAATPAPSNTPPSAPEAPAVLPFRVSPALGSAARAKKSKRVTLKASAQADISNLRLTLKPAKGGLAVADTTLKVFRRGTRAIKLKVKGLKPGSYVLAASGMSGGRQASVTQRVTVKK